MTKLIIQIPCYNEEATLGIALSDLPRDIPGISHVEWLVIDDGSKDKTVEVAKSFGVDHIINLSHNQGLAKAFMTGIEACLIAEYNHVCRTWYGKVPLENLSHLIPINKMVVFGIGRKQKEKCVSICLTKAG